MKTKPTSGPWECWQPGMIPGSWAIGPNGKTPIAKTLGSNGAVNKANAHLMASAPELLQLLQDVGAWLEVGLALGQINRGTRNRDADLVSQIREAIAKAKGEK